MPRKSKTSNDERVKAEWRGFFNLHLLQPDKDKIKYDRENAKPGDIIARLTELAEQGYKVSIVWETERNCYAISAFASYTDNPNAGRLCSTRHRDFDTAALSIYHIIAVIFEYGQWAEENESDTWLDW